MIAPNSQPHWSPEGAKYLAQGNALGGMFGNALGGIFGNVRKYYRPKYYEHYEHPKYYEHYEHPKYYKHYEHPEHSTQGVAHGLDIAPFQGSNVVDY